jgi:hypothetical protein
MNDFSESLTVDLESRRWLIRAMVMVKMKHSILSTSAGAEIESRGLEVSGQAR